MRFMLTAIVGIDACLQFRRAQQAIRCPHGTLAMDPWGCYGVEPWAFRRQPATHDTNATCASLHPLMVLMQPAARPCSPAPRDGRRTTPGKRSGRPSPAAPRQTGATAGLPGLAPAAPTAHHRPALSDRNRLAAGSAPGAWGWPPGPSNSVERAGPADSTRFHPHSPAPRWAEPSPAGSGGRGVVFASLRRIGAGAPVCGPLPRHPQSAAGQATGVVAGEPRGEALGKTDLGGQRERPATGRLAKRSRTLVQEGPEAFAGPRLEDDRHAVRAGRLRLQRGEAAWLNGMNGVAHGLVGAVQVTGNGGG